MLCIDTSLLLPVSVPSILDDFKLLLCLPGLLKIVYLFELLTLFSLFTANPHTDFEWDYVTHVRFDYTFFILLYAFSDLLFSLTTEFCNEWSGSWRSSNKLYSWSILVKFILLLLISKKLFVQSSNLQYYFMNFLNYSSFVCKTKLSNIF